MIVAPKSPSFQDRLVAERGNAVQRQAFIDAQNRFKRCGKAARLLDDADKPDDTVTYVFVVMETPTQPGPDWYGQAVTAQRHHILDWDQLMDNVWADINSYKEQDLKPVEYVLYLYDINEDLYTPSCVSYTAVCRVK
jgi:hypothetical protein